MGSPVISDFNLNSEGCCFFCLNQIPVKVQQQQEFDTNQQLQKYSVHYLARYLKMDMGKVLIEKGQRDSALLAKVRKSRLKVELCEKCTSLNKTFSRLYRQLEKLELEIKSNLGMINEELLGAGRGDKLNGRQLYKSMGNELSQIVDVLREEAIQKCSQKLRVRPPRVEMKRLTKTQIEVKLSKHQTNQTDSAIIKIEPDTLSQQQPESIAYKGNIKTEFEPPNDEDLLSDDDTRNYDMDSGATYDEEAKTIQQGSSNLQNLRTQMEINKNSLVVVSAASASTNSVEGGKHSFNPETRRYKCSACTVELSTSGGIQAHYKSVHQKIRYKCVPCGKEFSHRHHYNRHHQSVHVGVRFKCLVCNQIFSQKDNLRTHQLKVGCRKDQG